MRSGEPLLAETERREVTRVVWLSRVSGLIVAVAMWGASLYIHWGDLASLESVAQMATVGVGLGSFVALSTIARIAHARALERSLAQVRDLSAQLKDVAESDPLTGLANLRAFQSKLQGEIDAARATNTSVSLVVADLDNFKLLNDAFGHQFGDQVLRATGDVFAACGGPGACAARLGGDEFALVLPYASREDAVAVASRIESALRDVRIDKQQPATLGSFGIGTYPNDGESVQALFAAADSRMYSEKHRRKADSLSSLAGAARKLFVRVGQAMSPGHSIAQVLQEICVAAKEEFALTLCMIRVEGSQQEPVVVVSAVSQDLEARCLGSGPSRGVDSSAIAAVLPGEAWIIEAPIHDDGEPAGKLVMAGMPMSSFRPDAPVALALADLVQAVIANGRAQMDAVRAGRERDIYIDLARALAGGGSLNERLAQVTALIAGFIGVATVTIEGVQSHTGQASGSAIAALTGGRYADEWERVRASDESQQLIERLAAEPARVINEPARDPHLPAPERRVLELAGIESGAICPIRFDGQPLGVLAAASNEAGYFDEAILGVLAAIANHLAPSIKVALLRDELEASYARLEQASRDALTRLADAAEARDPHTGGHLRRIRDYSVALARELGVSAEEARAIGDASTIHDLGKLRLPDSVLQNPGKLDEGEWDRMREHPVQGERLIGDSPMFTVERAVARWHHERWDGSGYPDGLAGEQIPLAARIVSVADAFDALTTERPYKGAWTVEAAFDEIVRCSGRLFCPTVVAALGRLYVTGRLAAMFETSAAHESDLAA